MASDCCQAEVRVMEGEEGTNYYMCLKCSAPCDDVPTDLPEAGWEEFDERLSAILKSTRIGTEQQALHQISLFRTFFKSQISLAERRVYENCINDLKKLYRYQAIEDLITKWQSQTKE